MQYVLAVSLLVAAVMSGIWDVSVIYQGQPEKTVSAVLMSWSLTFPIFPFALGILMGHIFWPQDRPQVMPEKKADIFP